MATLVARSAAFAILACLIGACTTVEDIQQTRAVTSLQFESSGERYVVYNSVKGQSSEGLSHYAITVGRSGSDSGFAELRVMAPASSGRFGRNRLSQSAMQTYWTPFLF